MLAQVFLRRRFGRRLSDFEERAQTPITGHLQYGRVAYKSGEVASLSLHAPGNVSEEGSLLWLYEPVMVGLGHWWISFRGFESVKLHEGLVSYAQEWRCYVVSYSPDGLPIPPTK